MFDFSTFEKKWDFLGEKPLFIACSGGLDSMVLLDLFRRLSGNVTALHVNYHLRGEESDGDEACVKTYCEKHGIRFECLSIRMKEYLAQHKGNLQEEARKVRYDWFRHFLETPDSYLLLGHHLDDQVETFYQRLARKAGVLGMGCMEEVNGQLIRPLLSYTKEEIRSFALSEQISWREDSSNASLNYSRNRLRNEFLPFIEKQIPELKSSVEVLVKVFQEQQKEVVDSVSRVMNEIEETACLKPSIWKDLTVEQRLELLKRMGFNNHQLDAVEKLFNAQKGKMLKSVSHRLIKEEDYLSVTAMQNEIVLPELLIEEVVELPHIFSKDELYLDAERIKGTLQLRPWKIGDRIASIGIKGTQLISDVISDAKIPHVIRNSILVLTDAEEIHWCVGLKVGRKAIAGSDAKRILKIVLRGYPKA